MSGSWGEGGLYEKWVGQGAVSRFLAASTRHVRFIVQDSAAVATSGEAALPEDLKERIDFMPHDFFHRAAD